MPTPNPYNIQLPGTDQQLAADLTTNTGTASGTMNAASGAFVATAPAASTGINDPQKNLYGGYTVPQPPNSQSFNPGTAQYDPRQLTESFKRDFFDPFGPISRPEGGRQYQGPWVDTWDKTLYQGDQYRMGADGQGAFKFNQAFMTNMAQCFDPFMQRQEMARPHWWLSRVPRTAFKLFNGAVQESRFYRGGLSVYAGLGDWEDLAPDPTTGKACEPMPFRTYQYAWENRAYSGKKTAWGSDPICLDLYRFTPHAIEQLGWILDTGVKFGTDIQNIWNRDMFIYHTVMAKRSYVMTAEYRGAGAPRYVYEPFCKFSSGADKGTEGVADKAYVSKPFVVIDASVGVEPLNFDVLEIMRKQLERQCPEAAVGRFGNGLMFALAVSEDDVWNYIRGNEELRRYYVEADPKALIAGWISPDTFKRWAITCDGDQLRFKYIRRIEAYTAAEAKNYGYVGYQEICQGSDDPDKVKPVYIAEFVPPEYGGRPGVNGAPIPEANPEYDLAELAIAPVFMNHVFTNQFVPDTPSLGHGTWFGPKKGLNGRWGWYNVQTKENIEQKVGNFYGIFEIVPKPEPCAIYATSFIYRRCAQPLPSVCPAENAKVNHTAALSGVTVAGTPTLTTDAQGVTTAKLQLSDSLLGASTGDELNLTDPAENGKTVKAFIIESLTGTKKEVQIEADKFVATNEYAAGDLVVNSGTVYACTKAITAFSATTAYAENDLVTYGTGASKKVYKAKSGGHAAGAWDAGDFDEVSDVLGTAFAAVSLTNAKVSVA